MRKSDQSRKRKAADDYWRVGICQKMAYYDAKWKENDEIHWKEKQLQKLIGLDKQLLNFFLHKGLLYVLIGFLLGRALILTEVLPFALPFFGAVLLMKNDKALFSSLAQNGFFFTRFKFDF